VIRLARAVIDVSALFVPRDLRRDWREQWLGELDALAGEDAPAPEVLAFALGAPRHALVEAFDEWRVHGLAADVRVSLRRLRREPSFTAACVGIIAAAVAANAAMFSVFNALLLRTPPAIHRGDRLVQIGRGKADGGFDSVSFPVFAEIRAAGVGSLQGVAAYDSDRFVVDDGTGARLAAGQIVSVGFFALLGAPPAPGREFTPDEERGQPVAIVAHDFWRRRFHADPAVIGAPLRIDGVTVRIVGVAPPRFVGPDAGTAAPEIWLPAGFGNRGSWLADRRRSWLQAIGRLRDGATIARTRAELAPINDAIERAFPNSMGVAMEVAAGVGLQPDARRNARPIALMMMGSVAVVLAIACINVAGLLLARGLARRRDLAVRLAIGASRARIVRESLVESVILALAGGVAAAVLCRWMSTGVRLLMPYSLAVGFEPDATVFAFTMGCAALTGLAFGVLPARQAARTDLLGVMREDAASPRGGRLRAALLVAQLALSFGLVAGAAVLVRSLINAERAQPGFNPDGVIAVTVSVDPALDDRARTAEIAALTGALGRLPGVSAVSAASRVPVVDELSRRSVIPSDGPLALSDDIVVAPTTAVAPSYFRTLGISIVRGRAFEAADGAASEKVAIVSAALAAHLWGADDPIGRTVRAGADRVRVVGVAGDAAASSLRDRVMALVYQPLAQQRSREIALLVRVSGDPAAGSLLRAAQAAIVEAAPATPIVRAASLRSLVAASLATTRLTATLLALYGGAALMLAAAGVYALQLHATRQRRKEFGVRLALGAAPARLRRDVLVSAIRLTAAGIAAGVVVAAVTGAVMTHLLFGVGPLDPVALTATAAVFVACGLAAAALPAWRAARVDPAAALRHS
jgi:predicted permease